MSTLLDDPSELRANAWAGSACTGVLAGTALRWAARGESVAFKTMLAPGLVSLDDWNHPDVGWGVVLPDRADVSSIAKSVGEDAPAPIRKLIEARGKAPVFRYDPELAKLGQLRHYKRDSGAATAPSPTGLRGNGHGAIPRYLLIVGSPAEIPWSFQYWLQTNTCVGRLDLDDVGLKNYVDGLIGNWSGSKRSVSSPVLWAVDHGHPDITRLMRKTIIDRLHERFSKDSEFESKRAVYSDADATAAVLSSALRSRNPAFVATSSHGATFPLDDPISLAKQLGNLVDVELGLVDGNSLLNDWDSEGAIWYAHACCSAGCAAFSAFSGLIDPQTTLGRMIESLGTVGARTAPLPQALLGGKKPLGAFVGHVEPTFNWTLYSSSNSQTTTDHVVRTLYDELHAAERPTIGRAMSSYYRSVAGLLIEHLDALDSLNKHEDGARERVIRTKLIATDLLSMVILGDPTVRLPLPGM